MGGSLTVDLKEAGNERASGKLYAPQWGIEEQRVLSGEVHDLADDGSDQAYNEGGAEPSVEDLSTLSKMPPVSCCFFTAVNAYQASEEAHDLL